MRSRHRIRLIRQRLHFRQKGRCFYCNRLTVLASHGGAIPPDAATIDHIVPKFCGGTYKASNVVLACRVCNQAKGKLTGEEFLLSLVAQKEPRP
ncbi:HNH endonuclease [Aureimonas ureilytica]|uniref:HNH endonuclease n=1 Tax=Aureimonas ureilytica TaxID=401562 RepID=UPI0003622B6F|nr:HNH endonuclease [Aureimonas ureilytica]